jgi:hypothetical protein
MFIFVEDFEDYREGTIVDGERAIAVLQSRGAPMLPVDPSLFDRNPIAGYSRRSWGNGGQRFERMIGHRACPLMLYVIPGTPTLHWTARVEPIEDTTESKGTFRLTTNTGVHGVTLTGGLVADDRASVIDCPPDANGGWTIGGSVRVNCAMEGFLALSIYGAAVGLRVVWAAVTQAK